MRLRTLVPPLPSDFLNALDLIGIHTVADLLFLHVPADIFRRLPAGSVITLRNIEEYSLLVAKISSAACTRGDEDFAAEEESERHCPSCVTGVPELDALLHGLYGVVEISGEKGSGKTTFALHIVLRHLATEAHSSVLWIDTTGSFSVDSVATLLSSHDGPGASTVLDRLQVSLAFDVEAAHDTLETLRSALTSEPCWPRTRIVVIDTISTLIGPLLSAVSSQGHAAMTTFMRQLRAVTQAFKLTILVLNGATSVQKPNPNPNSAFTSTRMKPALGPSFTFLSDATLWLSKENFPVTPADTSNHGGGDLHVVELFRSRKTRSKTWCAFRIQDGVLHNA